jgi:hypothetical protein
MYVVGVKTFEEIVDVVVNLLREHPRVNIVEILKVISLLPRMVEDQEYEELEAKITKEELKVILS